MTLFAAAHASAAPAAVPGIPLTGTFTDATGGTGTATGAFTPNQFIANGYQLLAEGVADVTLVDSAGQVVGSESRTVQLPVDTTAIAASCEILDLVLGPLDLNGLAALLNQILAIL